jgi:hypothetical protein
MPLMPRCDHNVADTALTSAAASFAQWSPPPDHHLFRKAVFPSPISRQIFFAVRAGIENFTEPFVTFNRRAFRTDRSVAFGEMILIIEMSKLHPAWYRY